MSKLKWIHISLLLNRITLLRSAPTGPLPPPESWCSHLPEEQAATYPACSGLVNNGLANNRMVKDCPDEFCEKHETLSAGLFEGDMLGIDLADEVSTKKLQTMQPMANQSKLWTNGTVPYQFSEVFTENDHWFELKTIKFAMEQITSSTSGCIRFINRTTEMDYIYISRRSESGSDIGRQGGRQVVSLAVGCLQKIGSIQHELLHALGFYHEMSRKNRDEYIWINWDNIQEPYRKDFRIVKDSLDFGIKYDYESVLHYGPNAFAIDPLVPTIIPKQGHPYMGQNDGLSFLDVIRLNKAYNCPAANDITLSESSSFPISQPDNGNIPGATVIMTSTSTTWSIEAST